MECKALKMKNSFRALTEPSGSCLSAVGENVSLLHKSLELLWSGNRKKHKHK